ncbi:MAG: L,D-transpeptidase [Solirubrobacteraceae bacterium]
MMRAAFCVAALLAALPASPAAAAVPRTQRLVEVYADHAVHQGPQPTSLITATVRSTRPITGERTTLPVLGRRLDESGLAWVRVRLPGRVLGAAVPPATGWIRTTDTLRAETPWHLVVHRAIRRVVVYRDGRPVRVLAAIVGAPSTPSPRGYFFVEESVRLAAWQSGSPFALATSARSAVLQEFEGGPGQIALHGRGQVGGRLGTAVSHGCVRLAGGAITWLARRIGPGVPVTIV